MTGRTPLDPPDYELEQCACKNLLAIKMMSALSHNPICCTSCNREVAPERLNLTNEEMVLIAQWRFVYDAIDRLWFDSGDYEAWARRELCDLNSAVNKRGLAVHERISKKWKCYYWVFTEIDEVLPRCPSCEGDWLPFRAKVGWYNVCENCLLMSVSHRT